MKDGTYGQLLQGSIINQRRIRFLQNFIEKGVELIVCFQYNNEHLCPTRLGKPDAGMKVNLFRLFN